MWLHRTLRLAPRSRGFHLITREINTALPELRTLRVGLLHVFIQHTSASLALQENADPDVQHDLDASLDQIAPENAPYYRHTLEGPDDMPAHVKAMLIGPSLTLPVHAGRLALGTWQGVHLAEHRDRGGARTLVLTLHGESSVTD